MNAITRNWKKRITTLAATLALSTGAVAAPTNQAHAGIIVAVGGTMVLNPVLGVSMMFGGFGTFVGSIYYGIANMKDPKKAWLAYGLFCLDEDMKSGRLNQVIAQRYPELDASIVEEIAIIAQKKSETMDAQGKEFKDVILTEQELSSVLEVLDATQPEQAALIRLSLTQAAPFQN